MYQYNGGAKISNANAVVTKGYTKKLSVTGAKVKAWKSKDSKIAKVDKNGKVTGVKAGKTTVYAVTEDGENLTSKVIQEKIIDPVNCWVSEFLEHLTLQNLVDAYEQELSSSQDMYYI